jgi:SAM-dependent methyltransferase
MNIQYNSIYYRYLLKYKAKLIYPYLVGKNVLDYGCGADSLLKTFLKYGTKSYDCYDPYIEGMNTLPTKKYDVIVCFCVLEEVEDPQTTIKEMISLLNPKGKIIIQVPNSYSLNRMMGVYNGFLDNCFELDYADMEQGHKRYYDIISLHKELNQLLSISVNFFVGFKPLPLYDMDKIDSKFYPQMQKLIDEIDLEKYCAEIMVICDVKDTPHTTA